MKIQIQTENYGRTFDHGTVTANPDDVERRLDVDVSLSVAGTAEKSPDQVVQEFADLLEELVQNFAI